MRQDSSKLKPEQSRRFFLKKIFLYWAGTGLFTTPIIASIQKAWATSKRIILPRGTKMSSLVDKNPATLDARNLEIMSLGDFETMGLTDHEVNLDTWRLEVTGAVKHPLSLSYSQLTAMPAIERNVLLICPGFFTNHGHWRGISIGELLKLAGAKEDITHVSIRGPQGRYANMEKFPMAEIISDQVFLAYQVNGQKLPRKHGFPLRAVAEDHYGSEWVKYVHRIEAHKIEA